VPRFPVRTRPNFALDAHWRRELLASPRSRFPDMRFWESRAFRVKTSAISAAGRHFKQFE